MNKPKVLTYDEWVKLHPELDEEEEDCPKCDGLGECPKCEQECCECNGFGKVDVSKRLYEEQKQADERRWKCYNEQFVQ